ncbi:uncharacterized protein [Paramormyrops kingsleyae]|uniref:uncharacterized protein n=1 Tax=Paramormyrops kingsleyae TaxID=1676925 RepID=UPI000CD6749E|nr:uncharacterized protein LOC111857879 [Paramormyrops kingsleyae]XP_023694866.1 uncharacterized protein LOC111857879 [Paramormyrops kingsleyae]
MATVYPTMAVTAPKVLSFLSWNLNGLASALKEGKEKKELMSKKMDEVDVVFFQETHIGEGNEKLIQRFTDWHLHYTTYDTARRGVATLVNRKVHFSLKGEIKHNDGGYLVLICEIEGQPYTLVSVYNHQTDTDILRELSSVLQEHASGMLVIGGDFNTVLNPYIDKTSPTPNQDHLKLLPHLKTFIRSLQLVDVWRRRIENNRFYTFHCKKNTSRIDYFFLPEECLWRVQKCEIEDIPSDDHLPISLQLNMEVIRKDPNLDSEDQHRPDYETSVSVCMGNLSFSLQWIKDDDIIEAIKSLQMSDTPRPNGRPVTSYKSNYCIDLQSLYNKITDGSFDCQSHQFNKSIPKQTFRYFNMADFTTDPEYDDLGSFLKDNAFDNSNIRKSSDNKFSLPWQIFHFFNVNYVILATILARRLEMCLESKQPEKPLQPDNEKYLAMYYHFIQRETVAVYWQLIENSLENVVTNDCEKYLKALKNILKNDPSRPQHKLLCHGCPLTPVLRSFLLKYYAEKDLNRQSQVCVYGDYAISVVPREKCKYKIEGDGGYRIICTIATAPHLTRDSLHRRSGSPSSPFFFDHILSERY